MRIPFSTEQFLGVFAAYNTTVWPIQFLLFALAVLAIGLVWPSVPASRSVAGVLALLWLWMGAAYHLLFFTGINPAAYGFGIAFIVQAILFAYAGVFTARSLFGRPHGVRAWVGGALLLYALLLYPALGYALGHSYPASPTFGLPCPTTIFTFGMLLCTVRKVPWWLLVIPVLWALIGTMAALKLGILEDLGLPLAAAVSAVLHLRGARTIPG